MSLILQANRADADVLSPEIRLGLDRAECRRRLEGQPQSFGDGRKWIPFQMIDPALRVVRQAMALTGVYVPLAKKATRINLVENEVYLRGVSGDVAGLRVLHLSDLHIDGSRGLGTRLAEACSQLDFDLAVITGDLRLEIKGDFSCVLEEMRPLLAVVRGCKYGAFGVLGNHDELSMVAPLEDMGLNYLLNESKSIDVGYSRIHVAGTDDAHFYGTDDINEALAEVPVDDPCIFLCHSPDLIHDAAERFCDLYLCGHTHGGQICLPGGKPIVSNASVSRRFCSGSWILGGMRGFTSRGIGFSVIPCRTHCSAEIIVHVIQPERRGRARLNAEEATEKELYDDEITPNQ